jgi:hypothetical protein
MSVSSAIQAGLALGRQARDSWDERKYRQELTALQEQQAGLAAQPQPYAQATGPLPEPTAGGYVAPEAMPVRPMTPQQMTEAQLGLANKYGRTQEAQLLEQRASGLRRDATQSSQFDQQMAWNEQQADTAQQRFEQERQDRLNQTSIDRNQRAAFDALNYKLAEQRQGIAQSAENREADAAAAQQQRAALEQLYASNTSKFFSGEDTTALFNPDIPQELLGMYSQIIAEKLEQDFGVTQREFRMREGQIKEDALKTLNIDFSKQPEKRIRALQDLATRVYDSNPYDDVKLRIVPTPDVEGGIVVYEGNQVRGQFNSMDELQEAITDAVTNNAGSLAYKNLMDERKLLEALSAQDKRDFETYKIDAGMRVEYAKQIAKLTTSQSYLNKAPNIQLKMENNIRKSFGMPLLEGAQGLANKQAGETGATPTAQEFLEELSGSSMYNLPR